MRAELVTNQGQVDTRLDEGVGNKTEPVFVTPLDCALAYWGSAMTYVHPLWPDTVPDDKLAKGQSLIVSAFDISFPK